MVVRSTPTPMTTPTTFGNTAYPSSWPTLLTIPPTSDPHGDDISEKRTNPDSSNSKPTQFTPFLRHIHILLTPPLFGGSYSTSTCLSLRLPPRQNVIPNPSHTPSETASIPSSQEILNTSTLLQWHANATPKILIPHPLPMPLLHNKLQTPTNSELQSPAQPPPHPSLPLTIPTSTLSANYTHHQSQPKITPPNRHHHKHILYLVIFAQLSSTPIATKGQESTRIPLTPL